MNRFRPVALLLVTGFALANTPGALAQPANPPAVPPNTTVIRPQPDIDPGIKVTPKPAARMPTPVIKPHPDQGNTVVVPKLGRHA